MRGQVPATSPVGAHIVRPPFLIQTPPQGRGPDPPADPFVGRGLPDAPPRRTTPPP